MPYPQSPDFQGIMPFVDGAISFQPLFPNHDLFPGRDENFDQDFLNVVAPYITPVMPRYYAYPRRRVVR